MLYGLSYLSFASNIKVNSYVNCNVHNNQQVIDMRWGVRDEATDDHQTMAICRDEVS